MGCIDEMNYEILLSKTGFKECAQYIDEHFKEVHHIPAGYRIFDSYLIGVPPIPIAVENDDVIIIYIKPCHGSFVLRINSKEEVEKLRARKK